MEDKIQRGSLLKCLSDFIQERATYKYNYPHWGDYLIVSGVARHYPTGELLLTFEDLKIPVPLAENNFRVVQTAQEGQVILQYIKNLLT